MADRFIVEEIRQRIPIEEVVSQVTTLKPGTGGRLLGLCPFHQEDTPSFTVNPSQGFYYCFGCGEGGDLFRFVMNTQSIDFPTALKQLALRCGVVLKAESKEAKQRRKSRGSILDACAEAMSFFHHGLLNPTTEEAREAKSYLLGRGISAQNISKFNVGYAGSGHQFISHMHRKGFGENVLVNAGLAKYRDSERKQRGIYAFFRQRIMIPILNSQGQPVAFGGRCMPGQDNTAKYINSPESDIYKKSSVLYGLSHARGSIQRKNRLILVEGYFDVISMHQAGFTETIATCGTALTEEHLQIVRPLSASVYALFDMDAAGTRAVSRSLPLFLENGIGARRIELTDAKDPDEFLQAHGPEALEEAILQAEPLIFTQLKVFIEQYGLDPNGIDRVIDGVIPLLRKMKTKASREAAIRRVAAALGLPNGIISQRVGKIKNAEIKAQVQSSDAVSPLILDMIWLLVNYHGDVQADFANLEPDDVSSDPEILQVVGRLMSGEPLTVALEKCSNQTVSKRIMSHVVQPNIFESADVARNAGPEIALRLKIEAQKKIAHRIQFQITQYESKRNQDDLIKQIQELQIVQNRLNELQTELQNLHRI
ncbi:MAG: DNA primase [Myxococcota bacterium]